MASPRETILAALHARLSALAATALRREVLPERVPAAASITSLRDAAPVEPAPVTQLLTLHNQELAVGPFRDLFMASDVKSSPWALYRSW